MNIIFSFLFILSSAWSAESWTVRNSTYAEKNGTIFLKEYRRELPPEIHFSADAKITKCRFAGKNCKGPGITLSLPGKVPENSRETRLEVTYEVKKIKRQLTLSLFPENFPYFSQEGQSAGSDPLIFSVATMTPDNREGCHLFVMTPEGQLTFYRHLDLVCNDFRPHRFSDGTLAYSYQEVTLGAEFIGVFGPRVVLDKDFNFIRRIPLDDDGHEFILLGPDHWIGIELELDRLGSGMPYLNKRVRERKAGKIIFDWGVSDFTRELKTEAVSNAQISTYKKEVVAELLHLNSVQKVGEEGYLIGLGFNGVAFVDRDTRKISWILGGLNDQFSLKIHEHPYFLHTPWFDEKTGELILFSNWTYGLRKFSRVLSYKLDPKEKKLIQFRELRNKKELSYIMGSVQLTGDLISVGLGTKEISRCDFVEMKGNEETWKFHLGKKWVVYRFYRKPWE